jgi:hypothetical protein
MDRIPGLKLRISADAETNGIDYDQFNEFTHDYIEFQRDLYAALSKSTNTLSTITTVNNPNIVHKQNNIKIIKSNNAWELIEMK